MSTVYPLPDAAHVKDLLGMLFDGFTVKPGAKLDLSPKASSYFGLYAADDGHLAAFCGCDLAFATISGAALSMLPPTAAKEAAKEGQLPGVMLANLHEVMNICTRLIQRDESPHLRLRDVCLIGAMPAASAALLGATQRRIDFEVGIARYGTGALAVFCV